MINCTGCGANMKFDPASQMLKCDYCGTMMNPANLAADISTNATAGVPIEGPGDGEFFEAKMYSCPQCGAELLSDDDTAATFCSYCGASVIFDEVVVKMRAPSFVIPFKKTRQQCMDIYSSFIKKAIFAPSEMRKDKEIERLRGIYMPYWVYEMGTESEISGMGKKSHRSGDYIISDHYRVTTYVKANSNGTSYDASSAFADELSQSIAPYKFNEVETFSAGYLSGFYVDSPDVDAYVYLDKSKDIVASGIGDRLKSTSQYKAYNVPVPTDQIKGSLTVKKEEMAFFPVWFLSIAHKGYVSYAVVNGQTGKVAADIPVDYKKYIFGSLLLSLPIMFLLDLFFTPGPTMLSFCAIIFAIISICIISGEMNRIYTRKYYLDDSGLRSVRSGESWGPAEGNENSGAGNAAGGNMNRSSGGSSGQTTGKAEHKANPLSTIGWIMMVICVVCFIEDAVIPAVCLWFVGIPLIIVGACIGKVDKGPSGNKREKAVLRQPFSQKIKVLLKPLIAIAMCIILMIVHPFRDQVYYICVFVALMLVLLSFADIVSLHNKLARRLPRQFNRRGGDENENRI